MDINAIPNTRKDAVSFFNKYVEANASFIKDKVIYDLSAGSGYIANLFLKKGGLVKAFDLYPDQVLFKELPAFYNDLEEPFNIESNEADLVLCTETVECLPNQVLFFSETARILKENGRVIITAPNTSSLRSRFSYFVIESEHYSHPLPDETNAYDYWPNTDKKYFSKIFISGILKYRLLAAINKLSIYKVHTSKISTTSFLLLWTFPLIWYFSWKHYNKLSKKKPENKSIYREIFKLNTNVNVLLSKHLIIEFQKS